MGIIECNYLTPTHNKQDFDYNKHYRSTMFALGQKLNDYWYDFFVFKKIMLSAAIEHGPRIILRLQKL